MSPDTVIYLGREAMFTVLLVASPILGISLLVGILISFFQATTHLQEQTLTFVPKVIAVLAIMLFFGSWMMNVMLSYVSNLFINMNQFIR